MSAVGLSRPLIQFYYTVYLLFGLGGSLLVAFDMGKGDKPAANHTFSVVVWLLAIFSVAVTTLGLASPKTIVGIFCTSDEVYQYALDYFKPVLWGCVLYMGSFLFGTYTTIAGAPKLVSVAMIIDNVVNLCFDVILIKWLDMGTAGSAIASNIGHLVGIAIMASHYLHGKSAYNIVRVGFKSGCGAVAKISRSGAPFAVASICLTVYMYSANIIIQNNYGASGIYIFSVMLSLLTFYNFFLSGACNTLQSLGALLVGMGDIVGLRLSVNAAFRFLTISLVVCCGILWVAPDVVCELFGCPENLLQECCGACRIYAVAFIFFCLIYLLMVNYKLLKQESLANFLSFALSLTVIPVIWAIAKFLPTAIWWSNLIAYLLVFIVALIWSSYKRRSGEAFLTLLPRKEPYPTIDFSAQYSTEGLQDALNRISLFLNENNIVEERRFAVKLSAEELLKNIIRYSHSEHAVSKIKNGAYIDIRLSLLPNPEGMDKVVLSLRDDGKPFDPTAYAGGEGGYGLKLATAFNQRLTYKYMFGQNISIVEV